MSDRAPWTRKELTDRTREGLRIVERATAKTRAGGGWSRSFLARAVDASVRIEKEHRGFGRRLNQDTRSRAPVQLTGEAMVLSYIARRHEGKRPAKRPTWTEAVETREDCALAAAIREHLPLDALRELRTLGWDSFDYVLDIAEKS